MMKNKILGEDAINAAIEAWHADPYIFTELHKHLGWTREEYAKWVEKCIEPTGEKLL